MIFYSRTTARLALLSWVPLLLFSGLACSNGGAVPPPSDLARSSLEAALKSWRDGGKPGTIAGMEPAVQVTDTPWSQGDRLSAFEILDENTSGGQKTFSVRLTLTKPARVDEVQYYVMGQGPVLVFRDQDYERNINMVDGPQTTKTGKTTKPPAQKNPADSRR
jgi:hypothetical protein